jgi:hypothetical protein
MSEQTSIGWAYAMRGFLSTSWLLAYQVKHPNSTANRYQDNTGEQHDGYTSDKTRKTKQGKSGNFTSTNHLRQRDTSSSFPRPTDAGIRSKNNLL